MLSSLVWSTEISNRVTVKQRGCGEICHRKRKEYTGFPQQFEQCLNELRQAGVCPRYASVSSLPVVPIPWDSMPSSVSPSGGYLPTERLQRKLTQIENMISIGRTLILEALDRTRSAKVVEFCAGSGYVALPLATMFPQAQFVLLDRKAVSMAIAKQRVQDAQLKNVTLVESDLESFHEHFHVGIALHACGGASDGVLFKCLKSRASFVVSPCCLGAILRQRNGPLSAEFHSLLTDEQFRKLVQAADFGHAEGWVDNEPNKHRRIAKCFVEEDRCLHARSCGYDVQLLVMFPTDASPKNEILVGSPRELTCLNSSTSIFGLLTSAPSFCLEKELFGVCEAQLTPRYDVQTAFVTCKACSVNS